MNFQLNATRCLTTATLLLALSPALANANTQSMPKRYGDVYYLTGGVTQPDAQAMQAVASQYNLRVAFIAHTGQYLADVPVSIKNAYGNIVFDGVSDGPMLWIGVPPGRYVITARHSGQPLVQQVEVGSHMRNPVYFRWQVSPVDSDF